MATMAVAVSGKCEAPDRRLTFSPLPLASRLFRQGKGEPRLNPHA